MATFYETLSFPNGLYPVVYKEGNAEPILKPVQICSGETKRLMTWQNYARLHSSNGTDSDLFLVNGRLSKEDDTHYVLTFDSLSEVELKKQISSKKVVPSFVSRKGALSLSFDNTKQIFQLVLNPDIDLPQNIFLTLQVGKYQCKITFVADKADKVHTISTDCGSDAIQTVVYNSHTHKIVYVDLFHLKKEAYEGDRDLPDDNYLQYEPNQSESEKLFRNLCFKMNDDSLTTFCTNKEAESIITKGTGKLLDNVKQQFLSGQEDGDSYIQILVDMTNNAIKQAKIKKGEIIQLQQLVPNVMPFEVQGVIRQELQKAFSDYHVDISFFSESDAAFLGYARTHQLCPNTTYLIIDSGKCTTDWSIVRCGIDRNYTSMSSRGFIGAGALISFALLDHIFSLLLNSTDETRRKKFMRKILYGKSTDLFSLRKLLEAIEFIKRTYGMTYRETENLKGLAELGKEVDSLSAETLANYLFDHPGSYGDGLGIIHAGCNRIIDVLFTQLKEAGFLGEGQCLEHVILSGRAFRFPLYHKILTERFQAEGIKVENVFYDSKNAKSQALIGVVDLDRSINFNSGIYGQIQVLSEFTEQHIVSRDFLQKSLKSVSAYFSRAFGFNQIPDSQSIKIDEEFLVDGYEIELSDSEYLSYNGRRYKATDCGGKFRLYFTGDHLVLRDKDRIIVLQRPPYINETELFMLRMSNQSALMYTPQEDCVVTPSQLIS